MSSQVFAMHPADQYEYKENIVELQNNVNKTMDTSKWITHPVGRYLIKLPPAAQIKWGTLRFANRYELTWKKGLSYDGTISTLKGNENEIKNEMKKDYWGEGPVGDWDARPVSTRLQENFSPQKSGTLLTVDYDSPKYDGVTYEMYVVNKNNPMDIDFPERIYYFKKDLVEYMEDLSETQDGWRSHMKGEGERGPNTRIAAEKFIAHVADNIAPHAPSLPIETVRGIYFEGGFLFDPLNDDIVYPKDEFISIEVTFIDYPDLILKLYFNDYPGLIAEAHYMNDGTPIEPGKIEENTTVAGEPANERLTTFNTSTKYAGNHNTPRYFFALVSPTTTYFDQLPILNMALANDPVSELDKPSFESNEEAIAFWNAIKENVRWRPDNWKVKAPDGPYFKIYDEIIPAIIPQ